MSIPAGGTGIDITLAYMIKLARQYKVDPEIRALARSIIANVPPKNYTAEAQAIQNYVRNHIRYTEDVYGVETLQPPLDTLNFGQGDCDDQATLVATLLLAVGKPARYVAFAFEEPGDFQHVYTEVLIGDHWYGLETTENEPMGWTPQTPYPVKIRNIPQSALAIDPLPL